jgi:hypothetical protein
MKKKKKKIDQRMNGGGYCSKRDKWRGERGD